MEPTLADTPSVHRTLQGVRSSFSTIVAIVVHRLFVHFIQLPENSRGELLGEVSLYQVHNSL